MDSKDFYRREWLNLPQFHGGAHLIASVSYRSARRGDAAHVDAQLVIADCGRTVTLDFGVWGDDDLTADRRNALHKARLLSRTVGEMVVALEQAYAELGGGDLPGGEPGAGEPTAPQLTAIRG